MIAALRQDARGASRREEGDAAIFARVSIEARLYAPELAMTLLKAITMPLSYAADIVTILAAFLAKMMISPRLQKYAAVAASRYFHFMISLVLIFLYLFAR